MPRAWLLLVLAGVALVSFASLRASAERVRTDTLQTVRLQVAQVDPALPVPPVAPKLRWSLALEDARLSSVRLAPQGGVYVAGSKGLYAIDAQGKLAWHRATGPLIGTPALTPDGDLIVAHEHGPLERLAPDGTPRATAFEVTRAASAPVVGARGALFVADEHGVVRALDLSGVQLDALALGAPGTPAAPAATTGTSLHALDASTVVALGTTLGVISLEPSVTRRVPLRARAVAAAVGRRGARSWLLDDEGVFSALDADARVVAQLPAMTWLRPGFAAASDGSLRVGTSDAVLLCLDRDGRERWRRGLEGLSGPITLDARDSAIFATNRGALYALDADGRTRFHVSLPTRDAPELTLAPDGTLYFTTQGAVQAWR